MGLGRRLLWSLVLAALVSAGAAAAVGAYWFQQQGTRTEEQAHAWVVTLRPLGPGPYQLDLPMPSDGAGNAVRIALRAEGAPVQFGIVRTEYGAALSVRGDGEAGPVTLHQEGDLPLHLSMDDQRTSFAQFKFWLRLAEQSPPVNVTMRLREVDEARDWENFTRVGHDIAFTHDLQPVGWQRVRAEHDFDVLKADGAKSGFPRVVIGAVAAGAGAMYLPLGLVVLRGRKP